MRRGKSGRWRRSGCGICPRPEPWLAFWLDITSCPLYCWKHSMMVGLVRPRDRRVLQERGSVTKKEIVKQISDEIGLPQLKTKEIVQMTFEAIVKTLLEEKRIELRNFGVFEVK